MITINENQWDDIKRDFLSNVEYELTKEPLIRFDYKKNTSEDIGERETYAFTKADRDYMVILDKENKIVKSETEKDGKYKEHFMRMPDEFTYKLTVKFCDTDGNWKDSSAMESNFESDENN